MSNYIDYVYCQGAPDYQTKQLFQTDAESGIEAGDIVFVAGCGLAAFNVLAVRTIRKGSELEAFVRTLCGDEEVMWLTRKQVEVKEDI